MVAPVVPFPPEPKHRDPRKLEDVKTSINASLNVKLSEEDKNKLIDMLVLTGRGGGLSVAARPPQKTPNEHLQEAREMLKEAAAELHRLRTAMGAASAAITQFGAELDKFGSLSSITFDMSKLRLAQTHLDERNAPRSPDQAVSSIDLDNPNAATW